MRILSSVPLALLGTISSLAAAQPTERATREAVAQMVAQRHEGEFNGWPLLMEAIEASEAAHREVIADYERWWRADEDEDQHPETQLYMIQKSGWAPGRAFTGERLVAAAGVHGAFRKLHALAGLGQAWPPIDEFPAAPRAEINWWRPLAKLCRVRAAAMRMDAVEGKLDRVVEGAGEILAAGRICADQLSLQHRLYGAGFVAMALFEIREQVVDGVYDAEACRAMIGVIDAGLTWPPLELALEAERRLTVDNYVRLRGDPALAQPLEAALRRMAAEVIGGADPEAPEAVDPRLDWPLKQARIELDSAITLDNLRATAAGATRTMLALEIYRADHGDYPAQLAALAPEYLSEIPEDRISDQPLRYRKLTEPDDLGRRYLLYSVGQDGQDDGGRTHDLAGPTYALVGRDHHGYDCVFNHPREAAPEE